MAAIDLTDDPTTLSAYVPIYDNPHAGTVQSNAAPDRAKYMPVEQVMALVGPPEDQAPTAGLYAFTPEDEQPLTMAGVLDVAPMAAVSFQSHAVPEPGSTFLVGAAFLCAMVRAARRRDRA